MLTPKPQLNLRNARSYFREHLAVGDYYTEGHVVAGRWCGAAASRLGLEGAVTEDAFLKLCDGLHPETGKWLTARHNTRRRDGDATVSNRRVFYDFTISPPKSVSVVALYQDARIVGIHDAAARVMMDELEKFAETRVRVGGANSERVTGGVVGALFRHDTSRELDPHLHTHCILFNATFDEVENRWKALHTTGMYRAQKFAENLYYHELAKGLRSLGYEIENNGRDFEIKGVPDEVIRRFSKRHRQIDEETQKRVEAEGLKGNMKDLREQVAHDNRRRKIKNAPAELLRPDWEAQMTIEERRALAHLTSDKSVSSSSNAAPSRSTTRSSLLEQLKERTIADAQKEGVPDFLAWAQKHVFERQSVTTDYELLALALARGRGKDFTLDELKAEFEAAVEAAQYVRDTRDAHLQNSHKITSIDALERELAIIWAAKKGRNCHAPFNAEPSISASLSDELRNNVTRILKSRNLITLFQGGAGTGKSFTLREVLRGLQASGHPVVVATPQHQQANDLRRDGMDGAATLARVLVGDSLPMGAVVVLDEAGQVGGKDMLALIGKVQACKGRLILSGDTRQHGAVAAGDALRLIEKYTTLHPVRLTTIRRQDPAKVATLAEKRFVRGYRRAVQAASEGRLGDSFEQLDSMGCIRELAPEERRETLAKEYCAALERNEKVLVVAPTWAEVHDANAAIRERLEAQGKLGKGERVAVWQSLDLSEAQKQDARFYSPGSKVVFVRKYGRFERGDACEIIGFSEHGVSLRKAAPQRDDEPVGERTSTVSFQHADRFIVAQPREITVAPGERLQMKFNGQSTEGEAIRNGELVTVQRVLGDGRIAVCDDGGVSKTLTPQQRLFVPGYAVTSYASQGKTVDTVLATYAGEEASARRVSANSNQWYVAISRARKKVLVLTEDKEALRVQVEQESRREDALSLVPELVAEINPVMKPEISPAVAATQSATPQPALVPGMAPALEPEIKPEPVNPEMAELSLLRKPFPNFVQKAVDFAQRVQVQIAMNFFLTPARRSVTTQPVRPPPPVIVPAKRVPHHTSLLMQAVERANAADAAKLADQPPVIASAPSAHRHVSPLMQAVERANAADAAKLANQPPVIAPAPPVHRHVSPLMQAVERANAADAAADAAKRVPSPASQPVPTHGLLHALEKLKQAETAAKPAPPSRQAGGPGINDINPTQGVKL